MNIGTISTNFQKRRNDGSGVATSSGLSQQVNSFVGSANNIANSKPQPLSGGWQFLGGVESVFTGKNSVKEEEANAQNYWHSTIQNSIGKGRELQNQLSQQDTSLLEEELAEEARYQQEAAQRISEIEKNTFEEYQRGILDGQTIEEIASNQRNRRVSFVNEGANQQKQTLYRQQQFNQEQMQQQARQVELEARQFAGARGIGGSSIENQIVAGQVSETTDRQLESQAQLGRSLFEINKQSSKQIAEIDNQMNQDVLQKNKDMLTSFETGKTQTRQDIMQEQQVRITQLQNAYSLKRIEISEQIRKVESKLRDLMTLS